MSSPDYTRVITPIIRLTLSRPDRTRDSILTADDSYLLTTPTLYDELHMFTLWAKGERKSKSLELFPDLAADANGTYYLELGVTLPDLLPTINCQFGYKIPIGSTRHGANFLCISNQMVRVNCYRESRLMHVLAPEQCLHRIHEHGVQVDSNPPYQVLRTTVSMRFSIAASSVDRVFDIFLEQCAEDLAIALNNFLAAYLTVNSVSYYTHSTAFDARSFDVLYFAVFGGDRSSARVGRLALHLGKMALNPADISGEAYAQMLEYMSGKREPDSVNLMLVEAKNSYKSGLLRAALLQIVVATEMSVARFIHEEYLNAGVSQTKWNEAKKDLSYSQMLNLHLFALAPPDFRPDQEILGQLNLARRLRNEFMHEGKFELDGIRLGEIFQASEKFLSYIAELRNRVQTHRARHGAK